MSYLFPDYPHTNNYDGEVGFLIKEYKKLVEDYSKILEQYNYLYNKFNSIEDEFNSFKPYIDSEFNKFKKEFNDEMNKRFDDIYLEIHKFEESIYNELNDVKWKVDRNIEQFRSEIAEFRHEMNESFRNFSTEIEIKFNELQKNLSDWENNFNIYLENRLNGFDGYMKLYVSIEFKKCLQEMKDILNQWIEDFPPVRNPINGELEGINKVLNDIWRIHARGITVNQLVESAWTVNKLVEQKVTVMDIVTKGYDILYWKQAWKMYSPFNGRYVPISEVVYDLANLHKIPITIDNIISYQNTVNEIVNWNITAFDIIWKGGTIFAENN